MKRWRWHFAAALVLCTGCSAILGFKDGTGAGLEGTACEPGNSANTTDTLRCVAPLFCASGKCARPCRGDMDCSDGSKCTGRSSANDSGVPAAGQAPEGSFCVPPDAVGCDASNNPSCVPDASSEGGGILATFPGGNVGGITTLQNYVYFTVDNTVKRCAKTGCVSEGPLQLTTGGSGAIVPKSETTIAWANTNIVKSCKVEPLNDLCNGTSASDLHGAVAAMTSIPSAQTVFWLALPGLDSGASDPDASFELRSWGPTETTSPSVGGSNLSTALAAIDDTSFLAVIEGHLTAITKTGAARVTGPAQKHTGVPALVIAPLQKKRAIWTVEGTTRGLYQCEINTALSTLCDPSLLTSFVTSSPGALITAVVFANDAVYWAEYDAGQGSTRILSCLPGSGGLTTTGPGPCITTPPKTTATIQGEQVLFMVADGATLYMITNDNRVSPGNAPMKTLRKTAL